MKPTDLGLAGQLDRERDRIQNARRLDHLFGGLAVFAVRWIHSLKCLIRPPRPRARVAKILFIKLWGLGSVTLSEPALRRLAETHPEARIHYLTLAPNGDLFALIPQVERVFCLSFDSLWKFARETVNLLRILRRERYDLVFDGEFFVNYSALLARLTGARVTGFAGPRSLKRHLQDVSVALHPTRHMAAQFVDLVSGCSSSQGEPPRPRIRLPVQPVDRALGRAGGDSLLPFRTRYTVLNINAGPLAIERRWPLESFLELSRWLLARYSSQLVLIGSARERPLVEEFQARLGETDRVINLCGELSICELALVLSRARLLISNDSGPVHLASAVNLPQVGFYGPETPLRYGPLSDLSQVFYQNLECSPCMNPEDGKAIRCPHALACMEQIRLPSVVAAVKAFIEDRRLLEPQRVEPRRKIGSRGEAVG